MGLSPREKDGVGMEEAAGSTATVTGWWSAWIAGGGARGSHGGRAREGAGFLAERVRVRVRGGKKNKMGKG
jgi:hypothetical protein